MISVSLWLTVHQLAAKLGHLPVGEMAPEAVAPPADARLHVNHPHRDAGSVEPICGRQARQPRPDDDHLRIAVARTYAQRSASAKRQRAGGGARAGEKRPPREP